MSIKKIFGIIIIFVIISIEPILVVESTSYNHFPGKELAVADSLYLAGRYQDAIVQYQQVLQKIDNVETAVWGLYQLAGCYEYFGQYEVAVDVLDSLLTMKKDFILSKNVHFRMANAYFLAQKYVPAIEKLHYILDHFPQDHRIPQSLFQLGYACQQLSMYDQAITYYNKAKPHLPVIEDYIDFFIASCMIEQGQYQDANNHLNHIKTNYPESLLHRQATEKLAECYTKMEKYDDAQKQYVQLLETEEDENQQARFQYRIAKIYEQQQKTKDAITTYKSLMKNYPKSTFAYWAMQRLQELNVKETFEDILLRAEIISNQGYWRRAISIYNDLLEQNPNNPKADEIQYQIGRVYERMDEERQALKVYQTLLAAHPQSKWRPYTEKRIAECYRQLGLDDLALKHYKDFIKNHPKHRRNVNDSYYEMGRIYERKGDLEKAIETYQTLTNRNPGERYGSIALWRMAIGYYKLGKHEESINACQQMLKKYPRGKYGAQVSYWIGKNYEKMGSSLAAQKAYQQVVDEYGDSHHYAYAYYVRKARVRLGQVDWTLYYDQEMPYLDKMVEETEDRLAVERLMIQNPQIKMNEIRPPATAHLEKGDFLLELGLYEDAYNEFRAVEDTLGSNLHSLYRLARAYHEIQHYPATVRCATDIFRQLKTDIPMSIERMRMPICYPQIVSERAAFYELDPLFVCALIRQESAYNPRATSIANARGLMQVIPSTARQIARELEVEHFKIEDLYNPTTSIAFGTYYYSRQYKRFDSLEVALAAYNGGPGNANHWLKSTNSDDIDEFVENIKFRETRNYVKIVMNNYWKYLELYRMEDKG